MGQTWPESGHEELDASRPWLLSGLVCGDGIPFPRARARAEKFQARKPRPSESAQTNAVLEQMPRVLAGEPPQEAVPPKSESTVQSSGSGGGPFRPVQPISEPGTEFRFGGVDHAYAISDFLIENVPPSDWKVLFAECEFQLTRVSPYEIRVTNSIETLGDLILATRPPQTEEDRYFGLADLVLYSSWLLNWVRVLCSDPAMALNALQGGFRIANRCVQSSQQPAIYVA